MANLKVSLPEPCSEDWGKMAPHGCNRQCAACDTVIHDLLSMTVDQTEALLNSQNEICVRANVRPDGSVRTAYFGNRQSRRIIAVIGASFSLATAACQTTSPQISPRYEVSGQVKLFSWSTEAQLVSDAGKIYSFAIRGDRKFRFTNLRPGTYSLTFYGNCDEVHSVDNIAVQQDLNLGEMEWSDDGDCIIIGMMQRAGEDGNG